MKLSSMNREESQRREERLQRRREQEREARARETEKQQRREKLGWPDAEKDTGKAEEQVRLPS